MRGVGGGGGLGPVTLLLIAAVVVVGLGGLLLAAGGALYYYLAYVREPAGEELALAPADTPASATAAAATSGHPVPEDDGDPDSRPPSQPGYSGAGMTCELARLRFVSPPEPPGGARTPPSAAVFGQVLNRGTYLTACKVPATMGVQICVAIQNGRAEGVTVQTTPDDRARGNCIADQVRGLRFPSFPGLSIARTAFAPDA